MSTELSTSEKIKIILTRSDKTISELATDIDTSKQNLHGKLQRNNFCENDLKKIAHALGAKLEISFVFENERI